MHDLQASRTAQYMAFFRVLETMEPAGQRLFSDPYAVRLLSGPLRTFACLARIPLLGTLIRTILELGWPCTRSSGVVRTRAIDDMVTEAVRDGACQLVLLGAGFDSRAYRLQEAAKTRVFEVDHPATQQEKRARLSSVATSRSANVQFVPVDFEKDDLEARLIEAGFRREVPTVVVWEGVISYLTKPAVHKTLSLLARLLASGSQLIFTYMDQAALDGTKAFQGAMRWKAWVRMSGEPFIFGFDPDSLAGTLRPFGFLLNGDRSTHEIAQEYREHMSRHERGSQAYRVAAAIRLKA